MGSNLGSSNILDNPVITMPGSISVPNSGLFYSQIGHTNKKYLELTLPFQFCQRQEMGGGAVNPEEQQREVDVRPSGVYCQRRGVEEAAPRLQRREHQTQSGTHRTRSWKR